MSNQKVFRRQVSVAALRESRQFRFKVLQYLYIWQEHRETLIQESAI